MDIKRSPATLSTCTEPALLRWTLLTLLSCAAVVVAGGAGE